MAVGHIAIFKGVALVLFLGLLGAVFAPNADARQVQVMPFEQRQALELDCYNKQGAGCDELAKYYDRIAKAGGGDHLTEAQAYQRKISWAKKGCDTGGHYSCDAMGWAAENGAETVAKDAGAAHRYYKQGCQNGSALSCSNLGGTYYFGFGVAMNKARGEQMFAQACDMGFARGCERAQIARSEKLLGDLQPACENGSSLACYRIARLYATGTGVELSNDRATEYYHKTCFEQSDPHGCLLYGTFLADARHTDDWQTVTTRAFNKACELGKTETCTTLEEAGTEAFWPMAFAVMKSSCRIGLIDACWSIHNRLAETSWLEAARMGDAGCQLGVPELCHNAGVLYLEHPNVVGDPYYNAVQSFKNGCKLGYQPSCDGQQYAAGKSQIWRDVTFGNNDSGGLGGFLADLGRGIGMASQMGVPASTRSAPSYSPSLSTDTNRAAQDQRDFNNAVNAINNIGTGYNSTCPASNPYC